MKTYSNLAQLDDIKPNVCIITWRRQIVGLLAVMVLPIGLLGTVVNIGIYIGLPEIILILLGMVSAFIGIFLIVILNYWIFPKDVVHVESNALVGKKYGSIPFDSITKYNLDDNFIKIHRKGRTTIKLSATTERNSYNALHAAFASAISAWQAQHPASDIEQTYFYGSWKSKAIGSFLLLGSVGCIIAAQMLGMYGALAGAFMGAGMGIVLIRSKRR